MSRYAANPSPSASAPATAPAPVPLTPQQQQEQQQEPQHKRVYQACIPCRRRKVRCDLGSVDNPSDPPCVRCRRESKECYFSATRRKRKGEDGEDDHEDEYIRRNGRKRNLPVDDDMGAVHVAKKLYNSVPLTPGSAPTKMPTIKRGDEDDKASRENSSHTEGGEDSNANLQLENLEAQTVMRKEVYGPHDALDLLYKAATDSPHTFHVRQDSTTSVVQPSPTTAPARPAPREQSLSFQGRTSGRGGPNAADPIDPRLLPIANEKDKEDIEARLNSVENELGYDQALEAWGRFRFVRAGWFTREEAIRYIVYYYEYLSPMTPVSPPTFRNPSSHITLLTEEPILTVTLLTIATRYYSIRTTGGHCRSHAIHEELWRYLRKMIERCLWGQEAFGGGFCGSGADDAQTSSTAPWRGLRKGSLRTLGTIESLMILTEWHPRALHFPPDEAIDELMLPSREPPFGTMSEEPGLRPGGNVGGRRIESWLEPAWRSDRMCWMLLSNAMGLAYELGVFDDIDELLAAQAITRPEYEDESYRLRAMRIKRLLLIYLTQLAGRLGWTNMVPESIRMTDPVFSRKRPVSHEGNTPATNPSAMSNSFSYVPNVELDDQIIYFWVGVSHAMHMGNERLFRSRKHTTDIIQCGKYVTLLKEFQPILGAWKKEFETVRLPEYIRHILTIEYEYVRIYVHSLALQAVVERCAKEAGSNGNIVQTIPDGVDPEQLRNPNYLGGLPLGHLGGFGPTDQQYIKEVVDGSRNLLRTVVDGLLPKGYLKHAPVRTYFRIISGAMFLLKTFALGAPKSDVEMSINLLDRTVHALRNCVVDDIHLGTRFGDLLETLTTRLRDRFKYAPTAGSETKSSNTSSEHISGINGNTDEVDIGYPGLINKFKDGIAVPERSATPSISATPFDTSTGNFPYPPGSASIFRSATAAQSGDVLNSHDGMSENIFEHGADWTPDDRMWYLPPGPGLFQNMSENSNVTMTDHGVNVGGMDLLEYMAMDVFNPLDGSGF